MPYTYEWIDGQRVEWNVARDFRLMAAAFYKDTGCTLHIESGTRTTAEQTAIFTDRYRVQATGSGPYGDVRWWDGKRWVRHSGKGTVAAPKTSNHEEEGPNGPRSLDLFDSGSDPGVTTRGTARDLWMQNNAGRFGFENEGYGFREAWHKTYRRPIGGAPTPTPGGQETNRDEDEVIPYHRADATARSKGRDLTPGTGFYLHTALGMPTGHASNVVGGVGQYSITPHLYATGTPGDVVTVYLLWQNTKISPTAAGYNSAHYIERLVIDKDGMLQASREFKRRVDAGFAVYVRFDVPKTNRAAVRVTVADCDAYLFTGA